MLSINFLSLPRNIRRREKPFLALKGYGTIVFALNKYEVDTSLPLSTVIYHFKYPQMSEFCSDQLESKILILSYSQFLPPSNSPRALLTYPAANEQSPAPAVDSIPAGDEDIGEAEDQETRHPVHHRVLVAPDAGVPGVRAPVPHHALTQPHTQRLPRRELNREGADAEQETQAQEDPHLVMLSNVELR